MNAFVRTMLLRQAALYICLSGAAFVVSGCSGGSSSDGGDPHYSIAAISEAPSDQGAGLSYEFYPTSINDAGHVAGRVTIYQSTAIFPAQTSKSVKPNTTVTASIFTYIDGVARELPVGGYTSTPKITNRDHIFIPGAPYYDINGARSAQWTHKIAGRYVYVTDINDSDHYSAILSSDQYGNGLINERFVFDNGSMATDLGIPRSGYVVDTNVFINNSDQVAGSVTGTGGDVKLAIYSAPKTTSTLIDKGFVVKAINDRGEIIGNTDAESASNRALILANGSIQDIPPIAGNTSATVYGFNNRGDAVGASYNSHVADGFSAAFLYRNRHTANLNDLIPASSGWVLTAATSINNQGQICGFGFYQGVSKGFVLTPQ